MNRGWRSKLGLSLMALAVFLFNGSAWGQPQEVLDSLYRHLEEATEPAEKIVALYNLSFSLKNSDPGSAMSWADTLWSFAETAGDLEYQAKAAGLYATLYQSQEKNEQQLFWLQRMQELGAEVASDEIELKAHSGLGVYYKRKGIYDTAIVHYQKALELSRSLGLGRQLVSNTGNLANVYKRLGRYDEAIVGYLNAIRWADSLGNQRSRGINLMNLGNVYSFQGKTRQAIECMQEARTIAIEVDHQVLLAYTLNNLGSLFSTLQDYQEAEKYVAEGLTLAEQVGNRGQVFSSLRELGRIAYMKDQLDTALDFYSSARALALQLEDPLREANILTKIGGVFLVRKENQAAEQAFLKALSVLNELGGRGTDFSLVTTGLSEVYYNLGRYQESLRYGQQAYAASEERGAIAALRNASQRLAETYAALGNYERAYYHSGGYKYYSDSLVNSEKIREITTLENTYQFEQERAVAEQAAALREANLQATVLQERNLRNLSLAGILLLIAVLVFFFINLRNRRRTNHALQQKNETISELSRFKEAMTGMLVHDLKNPLSVILHHSSEKGNTQEMAKQMLQLVNNMLDVQKFEQAEVVLERAPVDLNQLVDEAAEQVRPLLSNGNQQLKLDLPPAVGILGEADFLRRVLTNLLTNAIKYSPMHGEVKIGARVVGDQVQVSVSDQGQGIPADQLTTIFEAFGQVDARASGGVKSTGLGLTFCKLALAAHDSDLQVDSTVGQGTTFFFTLPLASLEERTEASAIPQATHFIIPDTDRKRILALLPQLRSLPVFEAIEIEQLLDKLVADSEKEANQWVQQVLDAAYTGNQQRYEDLLNEVEADHSA